MIFGKKKALLCNCLVLVKTSRCREGRPFCVGCLVLLKSPKMRVRGRHFCMGCFVLLNSSGCGEYRPFCVGCYVLLKSWYEWGQRPFCVGSLVLLESVNWNALKILLISKCRCKYGAYHWILQCSDNIPIRPPPTFLYTIAFCRWSWVCSGCQSEERVKDLNFLFVSCTRLLILDWNIQSFFFFVLFLFFYSLTRDKSGGKRYS